MAARLVSLPLQYAMIVLAAASKSVRIRNVFVTLGANKRKTIITTTTSEVVCAKI